MRYVVLGQNAGITKWSQWQTIVGTKGKVVAEIAEDQREQIFFLTCV